METHSPPRHTTRLLPGGFALAAAIGSGDPRAAVLFLHGFGSNRHFFRHAFDAAALRGLMCVAPDLPGFGESLAPAAYGFSMEAQAQVMLDFMESLGIEEFHLVAHSMGGLVAMEMVRLAPERVRGLISLEGNLTGADCFFTRGIVALPYEGFERFGRADFVRRLQKLAQETPPMAEYVESFRGTATVALYESARHTVSHSAKGLIERFSATPGASYVYGERNRGRYDTEALLVARGVPVYYIPNSGHFMAFDNPEDTFALVGAIMRQHRP